MAFCFAFFSESLWLSKCEKLANLIRNPPVAYSSPAMSCWKARRKSTAIESSFLLTPRSLRPLVFNEALQTPAAPPLWTAEVPPEPQPSAPRRLLLKPDLRTSASKSRIQEPNWWQQCSERCQSSLTLHVTTEQPSPRVLLCYAQPQNTWQLPSRKTDEIFFGYIACMGLSTGVSRQRYFKYFCQKYQEIYNQCNPSDLCASRSPATPRKPLR